MREPLFATLPRPQPVPLAGMEWDVDPRAEWRQIFHDAWRLMRDFFYDPHMHGVDWAAVRAQYEAMLGDCASREELSYVIKEMISELNVGHAYYSGGDVGEQPSRSVGLLGCDYALEDGAYRIARIHHGAPWDADARGPLSQPGVDVKAGDSKAPSGNVDIKGSVKGDGGAAMPRAAAGERTTIFGLSPTAAALGAFALLVVVILAIVAMTRRA